MGYRYPKVLDFDAGYTLVEEIGGGGFSKVFRAVHLEDHRVAACKVVAFTRSTTDADRRALDKEMRVHSALKHKHVLEFINAAVVESAKPGIYQPGIYMLLEIAAGGDLFDKIVPDVGISEDIAHFYFLQMAAGVDYIHREGVCHRDLKPENILLDASGMLKISDFGLAAVFRIKESGRTRQLSERCGSLPYVAPELNLPDPYSAEPVDVWGMGVILFTLLAGNTPWDEPTENSPEYALFLTSEILRMAPWNRLPGGAMSLILALLKVDPAERATLADVLHHPWCMRPSQVGAGGLQELADRLTENLRLAGDMDIANPAESGFGTIADEDEDTPMASAHQSQFTQSLMLFSQTQSGTRYTPNLTRFYARLAPDALAPILIAALENLRVKTKTAPTGAEAERDMDVGAGRKAVARMRVGGYDMRKQQFRGWVELEPFAHGGGAEGSFCIMRKEVGNPISWRQLWKALIMHAAVEPHVFRRRD